jgi:hypothetical protein
MTLEMVEVICDTAWRISLVAALAYIIGSRWGN